VPSTFSGEPRDFFLGVVHAESNRAYQNYFYKMQVSHTECLDANGSYRVPRCRRVIQSAWMQAGLTECLDAGGSYRVPGCRRVIQSA
jgi:hypothetical protein